MEKYHVGILIFDEVEVLDFAGPFEVFTSAAESTGIRLLQVAVIGTEKRLITARNGLKIMPDYHIGEKHPPVSVLIVPGGEGTKKLLHQPAVLDWVQRVHETALITASVCSGARLLAKTGILDGLGATTHHTVFADVQALAPKCRMLPDERIVDNGKVITCGGVSAGIDMSLHILKRLLGERVASKTARYMEYGDWRNPAG